MVNRSFPNGGCAEAEARRNLFLAAISVELGGPHIQCEPILSFRASCL